MPDGDEQQWIEKRFERMEKKMADLEIQARLTDERLFTIMADQKSEAKAAALAFGRIESDSESEKDTRRRSNVRIDERFDAMAKEQDERFKEVEKGQTKVRLWIASATGIIVATMYFINLYFAAKGRP